MLSKCSAGAAGQGCHVGLAISTGMVRAGVRECFPTPEVAMVETHRNSRAQSQGHQWITLSLKLHCLLKGRHRVQSCLLLVCGLGGIPQNTDVQPEPRGLQESGLSRTSQKRPERNLPVRTSLDHHQAQEEQGHLLVEEYELSSPIPLLSPPGEVQTAVKSG